MVRCGSRNGHPKDCVLKRNQTICSKFANHLRLKGDPYDRSMSTKIFTLTVNLIFLRAPKFLTCKWLRAQFGFVNHLAQSDCVFFPYRRRSRCRERSIQITHVFLTCSMCVCVFVVFQDSQRQEGTRQQPVEAASHIPMPPPHQ